MDEGEQLIRDIWRRWNDGERSPEAVDLDPGIEIGSALAGRLYRGADGVREWIGEIDEQFESWNLGIDELRAIGPGAYIAHGRIVARGRQSGIDLDQPASWLVTLRAGRIARIQNFIGPDARAQAEEQAGG